MQIKIIQIFFIILCALLGTDAYAQRQQDLSTAQLQQRIQQLESRVDRIDKAVQDAASTGLVLFLCGAFCALWAQNTGRSAWLWFFLGAIFNVITLIALLIKNPGKPPQDSNLQDFRRQ